MQSDSSEKGQISAGYESVPSYWPVDRSGDIGRFLDLVQKNPGKPVFAHGRKDVGKTSLFDYHIRRHLESIEDPRKVMLGNLSVAGEISVTPEGSAGEFDEVLREPLILCVDQFHQIFDCSTRDQLEFLDRLREQLESDWCNTSVVFVLDDDEIGDLMALVALRPEFIGIMFQVRSIDLPVAIKKIIQTVDESDDWMSDEVLHHIAADAAQMLPDLSLGISPRFPAIIAARLIVARDASGVREFSEQQYIDVGRLQGLLEGFVEDELNRLAENGITTRETLWRIMDELVIADPVIGVADITTLAARIGTSKENCLEILESIRTKSGIIRRLGSGAYRPAPSQLHTVIRSLTRERRQRMGSLQAELVEHAETGLAHGTALPLAVLKKVLRNQYDLRFDQRTTQFVLDWVLRTKTCGSERTRYWLNRISDDELRLDIISNSAFDRDNDARHKATMLLFDFEVPEASQILVNLVIQDPSDVVRASAIDQLAERPTDIVRQKLYAAVTSQSGEYRENAIKALTIFPDEETVALLLDIANSSNDREMSGQALRVLTAMPGGSGASGVINIALGSDDKNLREDAADSLSTVSKHSRIRNIIDSVLHWRGTAQAGDATKGTIERWAIAVGNFVLGLVGILLNFVVPGVVLLMIREYQLGILFCALSLINFAVSVVSGSDFLSSFHFLIHLFLGVITLVWAGSILLTSKPGKDTRGRTIRTIVRVQIIAFFVVAAVVWDAYFLFGLALFPFGLVLFPAPHGFFHLLNRNWGRALRIFLLQLMGFGFWIVAHYQGAILYDDESIWRDISKADLNTWLAHFYMAIWYVLFVGTFAWDLIAVLTGKVILTKWVNRRQRRRDLFETLLCKEPYVNVLVDQVGSDDKRVSASAKRLLTSFGSVIPPELLLAYSGTDDKRVRRTVALALAKANSISSVSALGDQLSGRTGSTREIIVRALSNKPTQQSLKVLNEQASNLTRKEQRRVIWGNTKYAAGLVITPVGLYFSMTSFLVAFLIWEGSNTLIDPYRPIEKYVLKNCEEMGWPALRSNEKKAQLRWATERALAATNIAEMMLEMEKEPDHLKEIAGYLQQVRDTQCSESSEESHLLVQLAALGGLAQLATRETEEDEITKSFKGPALRATIQRGLSHPVPVIRQEAIQTLTRLGDLQSSLGIFNPDDGKEIAELLSEMLLDPEIGFDERQTMIVLLKKMGGDESVRILSRFVLESGSTFAGTGQRSAAVSDKVSAGLGISGYMRGNIFLAQQSIVAIGESCAPTASDALSNISNYNDTRIADERERKQWDDALKEAEARLCTIKVANEQATAGHNVQDEVILLANAFSKGDYERVKFRAERLLSYYVERNSFDAEYLMLLGLAGRSYYKLAASDPARTVEYWTVAEAYLDEYLDFFNESSELPDGDVVLTLARSRLGLARDHMDRGWSQARTLDERIGEFDEAGTHLEKIYNSESQEWLYATASEEEISGLMYLVWAFEAARLIDGRGKYGEASRLLEKSLSYYDKFAWVYYLRALTRYYGDENDAKAALADCMLSLQQDANYELPFRLIFEMRGDIDTFAELNRLKEDFATSPWPNYYLAVLHHEYLAPGIAGPEAIAEFENAYNEMSAYAGKVGSSSDPMLNIQWLELAITSGNLKDDDVIEIRQIVEQQSSGLGQAEVVANFYLALAVLQDESGGDSPPGEESAAQFKVETLDRIFRSYVELPDGTEGLWTTTGTQHYITHCADWKRCKYDSNAAASLVKLASILENKKDANSTREFEDSINSLKAIYEESIQADITIPVLQLPKT